jgi:trk system potassium uptake protein TrkA
MARLQVLIVGLGQFGLALARALADLDTEVIAVDLDAERIQQVAPYAAEAVVMNAMDERSIAQLRPGNRDLCVCAIGEESREASIVVTAVLKQAGARHVVSRTTDAMHERILRLVGADEVVNPERMMGEQLAGQLATAGVVSLVKLDDSLVVAEIEAPGAAIGRSLAELQLPRRHMLNVIAIRRLEDGDRKLLLPSADLQVQRDDVMVLAGPPGATRAFADGG